MSKKKKKQTIKIFFKDGKTDEIPQKLWDDYLYDSSGGSCLFDVIKKGRMDRDVQHERGGLRNGGMSNSGVAEV